jgi:hypothetical protein
VQASPEVLWPADGRYVEITIKVTLIDAADPSPRLRLAAITCNQRLEPGVDVREAAFGTDDRVFLLKATTSLATRDRIYRVTYQALDTAGNSLTATAQVAVTRRVPVDLPNCCAGVPTALMKIEPSTAALPSLSLAPDSISLRTLESGRKMAGVAYATEQRVPPPFGGWRTQMETDTLIR